MTNRQLRAWINGPRTSQELEDAMNGLGQGPRHVAPPPAGAAAGAAGVPETDGELRNRLDAYLAALPQNTAATWVPPISWQQKLVTAFASLQIASDIVWAMAMPIPFSRKQTIIVAMILISMIGSAAVVGYGFYAQTHPGLSARRIKAFIFFGLLGFFFEGIAVLINISTPVDDIVIIAATAALLVLSFTADMIASIAIFRS